MYAGHDTRDARARSSYWPRCGHARLVQRDPGGGVLELDGDHGKAIEQANQEMAKQCGPTSFTITQDGDEVISTDPAPVTLPAASGRFARAERHAAAHAHRVWRVHQPAAWPLARSRRSAPAARPATPPRP